MTDNTTDQRPDLLYVQMLGDLCLFYNGKTLSGQKVRAKQVWALLEFMLVNRNQENAPDRLMEALWEENQAEDPANALKNLAYRLRTTLKNSLGLPAGEYILFEHGGYSWNMDAPGVFDVDILEKAFYLAKRPESSEEERYARYLQVVKLYKGNYMPQSSYKPWIQAKAVYYQRLYMKAVETLCPMMLAREEYVEAEAVCRAAISCDPFVEVNHVNLMKALVGSNNQKKAKEHYNILCKLYMDELGIEPSETIRSLYTDVINQNLAFERDLAVIKEQLKEKKDVTGTLQCNFEVFQTIYRLEARAALRTGSSIYIALLTVTGKGERPLLPESMEKIMEELTDIICAFLRKNDVVCRYGKSQFLIMLGQITYENVGMVLDRLIRRINAGKIGRLVQVHGQARALDPLEWEENRYEYFGRNSSYF